LWLVESNQNLDGNCFIRLFRRFSDASGNTSRNKSREIPQRRETPKIFLLKKTLMALLESGMNRNVVSIHPALLSSLKSAPPL
jgi:hypothetical protein